MIIKNTHMRLKSTRKLVEPSSTSMAQYCRHVGVVKKRGYAVGPVKSATVVIQLVNT